MQHNLLLDLFGALTLPLIILVMLGAIAGVNPGSIISGYLKVVGGLLFAILQAALQVTGLVIGELCNAIAQQTARRQQTDAYNRLYPTANSKERIRAYKD